MRKLWFKIVTLIYLIERFKERFQIERFIFKFVASFDLNIHIVSSSFFCSNRVLNCVCVRSSKCPIFAKIIRTVIFLAEANYIF